MGQFENLRVFAMVVECESISKAANRLRVAKSAVSRRLALLENHYGTVLIDRSSGNWHVTDVGQELYQRTLPLIGDFDELESDFMNSSFESSGPLSISVPRDFGSGFLSDILISFKIRHPEIQLSVDFDDRHIDLTRENYDLAIRLPSSDHGEGIATQIGTVQHSLLASPGYLKEHSEPQSLKELSRHRLLYFGNARRAEWNFSEPGAKHKVVEFHPFLNSNNGAYLCKAACAGLGICKLPDFITQKAVARGDLVKVLADNPLKNSKILLVRAANRRMNRRMRLFSDEVKQAYNQHLKMQET